MTLHEDLALAEGTNPFLMQVLLMMLMTLVVALSLKIVGILLITSMLIIPAATARQFAKSPEMMAGLAVIFGIIAVLIGIYGSFAYDTPTGPSIVAALAIIFMILLPLSQLIHKNH